MLRRMAALLLFLTFPLAAHAQGHAPYVTLYYRGQTQPADILINEIRPTIATPFTYFNALEWKGGYTGLQMIANGDTGFIFSLWDPPGSKSDQDISSDFHLPSGTISRFGGEGTGLHYLNPNFHWTVGRWYRVVVRCWDAGPATRCAMWTEDEETSLWTHHVTMAINQAHYRMSAPAAFLEDWAGTGDRKRAVELRNFVDRDPAGQWSIRDAALFYLAPTLTGPGPYAKAFDAQLHDTAFFLQSGGETKPSTPSPTILIARHAEQPAPTHEQSAPPTPPIAMLKSSIEPDGQILRISWTPDPRTTPQFAWRLKVFRGEEASGEPIGQEDSVDAEARSAVVKLPPGTILPLAVKLTLFDIFDRQLSTELKLSTGHAERPQ
jgi:hypothetical protein